MFSFRKAGYSLLICMFACTVAFALCSCGFKTNETKEKNIKEEAVMENKDRHIDDVKAKTADNNVVNNLKSTKKKENEKEELQTKVTFVELGSVKCIPCKMMQPVMEGIEEDYGNQVKVVFYDVWTEEGKPYAEKYGIRGIPTQVFLDEYGNEFNRHTGFYPKEDIEKLLKKHGIEKKSTIEESN